MTTQKTSIESDTHEQDSTGAVPMTRLERRKARTRQSLIDAAKAMLAAGTASAASIQDITDAADVGFGSFYNYFEGKQDLFDTALNEVLENWGQLLDRAVIGVDDPAEVFAISVRMSGRLGLSNRQTAAVIAKAGFALLESPIGLVPRATRDLQRAIDSERFKITNVAVALSTSAGALFGLLHLLGLEDSTIGEDDVDDVAEQLLRMFGLTAREAHKLSRRALPALPA